MFLHKSIGIVVGDEIIEPGVKWGVNLSRYNGILNLIQHFLIQ